ncbi:NUDIX domain-containing protein [Salipiger abyssi]|uniref:NUDIX domain-containing protein n=1 Tax=Salipiger abyssi TaxID=1250539 RepID=UPI0040580367
MTERLSTNIMFADVKGYSTFQEQQIRTFHEIIMPLLEKRIEQYKFEYARLWGDGIAIASHEVKSIAKIATECRDFFRNLDYNQYQLPPLSVRISIHHGEYYKGGGIFSSSGEIFGKTVIQAARIEPITEPGQIWVTEAIHVALRDSQIGESGLFATDAIGEVTLPKNYGVINIWTLRREHEPEITEKERQSVFAAAEQRRDQIQKKQDLEPKGEFDVVLGVVVRDNEVLLVKRNPDASGLKWMFPSGKKISVDDESVVAFREVLDETGIACIVLRKLGTTERHPITGARCHSYLLKPIDSSEPQNLDPKENAEVRFVPINDLKNYISGFVAPHIVEHLENGT